MSLSLRFFLLFNLLLFATIIISPVQKVWAETGPIEATEVFWREMKRASKVIASLFDQYFDFEQFYERALVDHWSGWGSDQREEFGSKFKKRFVTQTSGKFSRILGKLDRTMKHRAERASWGYQVWSSTQTNKGTLTVSTYLTKVGEQWKIMDLDIEGALLSRNYRGQFNRILRRSGFIELIRRIEQG